MPEKWLSLSEAAQVLGVHPGTVRNWSDQGVIPVHRTSGGHRRYLHNELDLWVQSQRMENQDDVNRVVQNALRTTRVQISEGRLASEAWYQKLDEDARAQYRTSGRTLMQGLVTFMHSQVEGAGQEAEALGYEYASIGRRFGLSSVEAATAFMFFRGMLIESMLGVYEAAAVRSPHAWSSMFRKINLFTDRILMKILDTYEAYERGNRSLS